MKKEYEKLKNYYFVIIIIIYKARIMDYKTTG